MQINGWNIRELHKGTLQSFNGGSRDCGVTFFILLMLSALWPCTIWSFLNFSRMHSLASWNIRSTQTNIRVLWAAVGCPWSEGFSWREGWRSQDTNGKQSNNSRSPKFHLDGKVDNDEIKRSFCIKDDITTDRNRLPWPKGWLQLFPDENVGRATCAH